MQLANIQLNFVLCTSLNSVIVIHYRGSVLFHSLYLLFVPPKPEVMRVPEEDGFLATGRLPSL